MDASVVVGIIGISIAIIGLIIKLKKKKITLPVTNFNEKDYTKKYIFELRNISTCREEGNKAERVPIGFKFFSFKYPISVRNSKILYVYAKNEKKLKRLHKKVKRIINHNNKT
ncbi:hypothetical protein LCGC14_1758950 [marine sediment metagenome]|uniref:Uncharacterized protein n=1 Tax=marine sediment metagenome TaxID=412755 RepID=A0A0F9JGQ3_9ZZZZ